MTGDDGTDTSAGRLLLGRELRRLLRESGVDQSQARARANRLLPEAAAKLTAQRVSDRLSGDPGPDFPQLWALAEALLIECGELCAPGTDSSTAPEVKKWFEAKRKRSYAFWHALWEVARAEPPLAPDPRPASYLRAAARFAHSHPYPSLPGTPPLPPLPEGCVARQVRPLPPAAGYTGAAGEPRPAADVFTSGSPVTVLIGAPGSGKSTLLRVHLLDSVDGGPDGRRKRPATVPVLVPATALTGTASLSQALATAVTGLLSRYPPSGAALAEDFFARRPRPKGTWLVLVDGLDEVADREARAGLLGRLADEAATDGTPYRFVVATRPLPADELDVLGPDAARFELSPFTPEDLRGYARGRFRDLDDPDRHTELFTTSAADAGLGSLVRNPLMAAMLCGLYAADPGEPLPGGRTEIYGRFIDRIHGRNSHKRVAETQQRAIDALEEPFQRLPDRAAVRAAAERACNGLLELVDLFAHRMFFDGAPATLDLLAAHPAARRPEQVPGPDWHRFLGDLLRPTGLLSVQDGEPAFPHRTFLEYHAARHATCDPKTSAWAVRDLLDQGWFNPPALWPFGGKCWSMPVDRAPSRTPLGEEEVRVRELGDMSYAGFVFDLAERAGADPGKKLLRVARKGGAEGGKFIALQAALGTRISPETAAAARETLVRAALGPRRIPGRERVLAAETLVGLGDERGLDAFRAMAEDPRRLDTLDPWHMPLMDFSRVAPPSPQEMEETRRRTRRDTVARLDAVIRAAAPGAAVRPYATRARSSFGRLLREGARTRVRS